MGTRNNQGKSKVMREVVRKTSKLQWTGTGSCPSLVLFTNRTADCLPDFKVKVIAKHQLIHFPLSTHWSTAT